jgi:hypothetical protein
MLHHSVQYTGLEVNFVGTGWVPADVGVRLRHLTIDDASRKALVDFINKYGVRVILTGHVHRPYFIGNIATAGSGLRHDVLESCCGTTTQRPLAAAGVTTQNSLIVHRLEERGNGDIYWHSEVHTLALITGEGFGPPRPAPPNSSYDICVWP